MSTNQRKFVDDGWAVWIDGEDKSNVYLNDWINPKGTSYIDFAIKISGVKSTRSLNIFVPFSITREEIEDISLLFEDKKILHAIFSVACIIDYKKNEHTSEVAYKGKLVDIVHISTLDYKISSLSTGTFIKVDLEQLQPFLDNDEVYFIWRMPHKSLNKILKPRVNVENILTKLRDLITTPVVSEKYCYSVRINESRLLPEEVTKIGSFHRQKLNKAIVTIAIDEEFELNDGGCYRIRRLEDNLYKDFLPQKFKSEGIITYQWNQTMESDNSGQFNFYYNLAKNYVSRASMLVYMIILLTVGVVGELLSDLVKLIFNIF